ncbi:hypothetical protein CMUS01_06713 [Colletotrichum musicola]|uniref:Uncharacterized protein n=1 Tax=Colletotrichum musicola TaxID=2175873 RepID=A0A8H6KK39_9PEZI|nr:hypothetical protein CMUS01_06713 [Colletotrichum musicola]
MPFWRVEEIDEKALVGDASPPGNAGYDTDGDVEVGTTREKEPTDRFTAHQIFYVFGPHGIGAMVLSGGINFAIAYGMYTTQDTKTHPIRLFQLPNTLAGDAVVTLVIQTLMTWFIELALVGRDLRTGGVRPIGSVREPIRPWLRSLMLLPPLPPSKPPPRPRRRGAYLADQLVRAGLIFVVTFFLLWLPAVGILTAIGERKAGGDWDWYFQRQWAPEIFKGVFGGVLALLTTPIMASFWLVREGWRLKRGGARH